MLGLSPSEPVWLVLTVFAVWRLTALLAYERGPFAVLTETRRLMVKLGLGRLVGCFYCLSVWMSLAILLVFPVSATTPLVVLGVAGAVAFMERVLARDATTGTRESDHDD